MLIVFFTILAILIIIPIYTIFLASFKPGGDTSKDELIYPNDDGYALGYVGDTLRTSFFDMTVKDPYTCAEYDGLTPDEGYKFLDLADIS